MRSHGGGRKDDHDAARVRFMRCTRTCRGSCRLRSADPAAAHGRDAAARLRRRRRSCPRAAIPRSTRRASAPTARYVTPNFEMTDAAAVWHLRGALNVAALGCDQAGGGIVDGYNNWLRSHRAGLDDYAQTDICTNGSRPAGATGATRTRTTRRGCTISTASRRSASRSARRRVPKSSTSARLRMPICRASPAPHWSGSTSRSSISSPGVDAWRDYYAPKVPAPRFVRNDPGRAGRVASGACSTVTADARDACFKRSAGARSPHRRRHALI